MVSPFGEEVGNLKLFAGLRTDRALYPVTLAPLSASNALDPNLTDMIANYLKVAFRHLLKNKLYVLINTLGMGIAIACAMTVYLLIAYNIEFDSTVDKTRVKQVVKVVHHRKDNGGDAFKELVAPLPLGPAALHDIAGIT